MRKFFSRFSATGPTSPSKVDFAATTPSEKDNLTSPISLPSKKSTFPSTGNKTKALAAKFEVASERNNVQPPPRTLDPPQLSLPLDPVKDVFYNTQLPPLPALKSSDAISSTLQYGVPARVPGSSLPQTVHQSPIDEGTSDFPEPFRSKGAKEERQASLGSHAGSSNGHGSKSVAFAPSPEKQRTTSPPSTLSGRAPTGEPLFRSAASSFDNTVGGNFARPTVASQARARSNGRSSTGEMSQWGALGSSYKDKAGSTQGRLSKMNRPNSFQPPSRRSYSYSSAPSSQEGRAVLISGPASMSSSSAIGSVNPSMPQSVGRASLDLVGSSLYTASDYTKAGPSNSPLQFPTQGSVPMQATWSGSSGGKPASRRSSMAPPARSNSNDTVSFPVGGLASRSFGFPTWSEMTQEDLVKNLGPRERTRQEVLWEIVASEERYVMELEKAKEIYIDALLDPEHFDPDRLLPPFALEAAAESASARPSSGTQSKTKAAARLSQGSTGTSATSSELPIAARFMSTISSTAGAESSSSTGHDSTPAQRQVEAQKSVGSWSPYSLGVRSETAMQSSLSTGATSASYSRSDLAYGLGLGLGTTATRDRSAAGYMNGVGAVKATGKASKAHKLRTRSKAGGDSDPLRLSVPLPPSLKEVLVAISDGLVEAHGLLSDALKARYEEQWPLVRSLADVFMKHSHILEHYAAYVCHLQRAMEELEEAALMERAFRGKKLKKERLSHTVGLGRTVAALETCAVEQGLAGLSIFVSMPFQRLLKYPLLFQNLLFHTDPSTHEFESTVGMVVEVERLVRSIEDEKVNAEERDKTRDAFARIDGITDKQLLRPGTDRVLIEEQALYDERARRTVSESAPKEGGTSGYPSDSEGCESGTESGGGSAIRAGGRRSNNTGLRDALRNKRSYRRLSDFLSAEDGNARSSKAPSMGSKKDMWLVRFSDVEIKCQRIGVTALPMVSAAALAGPGTEMKDNDASFAARSKDSRDRLKALRATTLRAKTRNLYKFISVVAWKSAARVHANGDDGFGQDALAEEDEVEASSNEEDGSSSDSSSSDEGVGGLAASDKYIRTTKLSFTYWGDRIEPRMGSGSAGSTKVDTNRERATGKGAPHRSMSHGSDGAGAGAGGGGQNSSERAAKLGTGRASMGGGARTTHTVAGNGEGAWMVSSPPSVNVRSSSPTKRGHSVSSGGVSGRLSEPLSASSITTASESVQNVVAQMHARQRNEKFGGRLRASLGPAAGVHVGDAASAAQGERRGSASAI